MRNTRSPILVHVEIDEIRGGIDDLRAPAGLRRLCAGFLRCGDDPSCGPIARRNGLGRGGVASGVVRVEIRPSLRAPEEIEIERNEDEEERAEHGLENPTAPPIPTRKPAER